jgi:hypothetical protein
LISGCAKDDFVEVDGLCPEVLSTTPLNGSTNIPLDQLITLLMKMNPETINQSSFTLNGTSQIAGLITYSGKQLLLNHLLYFLLTQRILQQ